MEERDRSDKSHTGAIVWTTIVLVGAAALTYVVARRLLKGELPVDADSLLDAADRAANQLDTILLSENQAAS